MIFFSVSCGMSTETGRPFTSSIGACSLPGPLRLASFTEASSAAFVSGVLTPRQSWPIHPAVGHRAVQRERRPSGVAELHPDRQTPPKRTGRSLCSRPACRHTLRNRRRARPWDESTPAESTGIRSAPWGNPPPACPGVVGLGVLQVRALEIGHTATSSRSLASIAIRPVGALLQHQPRLGERMIAEFHNIASGDNVHAVGHREEFDRRGLLLPGLVALIDPTLLTPATGVFRIA